MSTVASTLGALKYATRDIVPTNDDNMIYYEQVLPGDYTAAVDGEHDVSFPNVPVGARMIQVERNTKPFFYDPMSPANNEWLWDSTARILHLLTQYSPVVGPAGGVSPGGVQITLAAGEELHFIYSIIKTTR